MENKNLTVWQRLSHAFGPNAMLNQDVPTYKFDKKELLRTQDKNDFERQRLQAQQTFYLSNQWSKIDNHLYTQAIYYEPSRMASVYDFEAMEYSLFAETKIATPDGFYTIKELADKGRDYEFITYAYDHNLKKVVPAKAYNAHYTRDEMTYKITFDDNSHIIATYGHRFLKRDGVFCEVENLQIGDSMMPFYRKSFYNNQNYNWVYTCNKNEGHHGWVTEHKMIAEWFNNVTLKPDEEVHHINFKGKNNLPENLKIMNISEHRAYHARLNNEKLWANPKYREKMSEVAKRKGKMSWDGKRIGKNNPSYINLSFDSIVEKAREYKTINDTAKSLGVSFRKLQNDLRYNGFKNWFDFLDVYKIEKSNNDTKGEKNNNFKKIAWDLLVNVASKEITVSKTAKKLNVSTNKITKTIKENGFNSWLTFISSYGIEKSKHYHPKKEKIEQKESDEVLVNHKIISIEPYGVVPVYDLTVPGYKNFATDTIFSHNTPEIGAALDIYAEESTTTDENGFMLQIYSESKRIKSVLTDLFNNVLDINTNLPMWTRNTVKFGDNFIYLKLDPEKGIVGCNQLPNIEIERLEPGGEDKTVSQSTNKVINDSLKFRWKNKTMEFQPWEVAHFRILGDDRKLPYGTSMLEKARRIWKQLLLAEDAMLIYRTSRAPERRVFKVFVGNMDDNDVEAYVNRVANKFKREQVVDSKTGNVDMRYNQMAVDQDYFVPVRDPSAPSPIETLPGACISLDTRIPLLDGRVLELNKIIEEWDNGNRNLWAYSCDPTTGDLAPGLITWAGVTRKDTNVLKITLDNGEQVITTPDHKFVHRTNGFVEAQNLKVGDSLMPFYQKRDTQQVWNVKTSNWSFVNLLGNSSISIYENAIETLEKDWELMEEGALNNHKITSIEILGETMDTGTITIDGNEIYHNYHTFAIESGIFIKNSNLGDIADIEYIQKKLVTALRIPKSFLGFEEVVGDGKTLSIQDIRFARTINRIQKCMLAELNKVAIVHLFLLGFEDEISNFTLGLTNPSVQSDLLKIDVWKEKIMLYRDAVSDPGSGVAAVSATWAKKHIFGFSDEEIRLDLQQQRIERAVGQELLNTALVIKKTGLFDNIDKLYGDVSGSTTGQNAAATPGDMGSGSMSSGGLDMGGLDMGGLDMGGEASAEGAPPPPPPLPNEAPGEPSLAAESKLTNLNILVESNMIDGASYLPLTKGQNSLGAINDELKKLLNL